MIFVLIAATFLQHSHSVASTQPVDPLRGIKLNQINARTKDEGAQRLEMMKGVQLYSWIENSKWQYALVSGRNSIYSAADVKSAKMDDLATLKSKIRGLPSKTSVSLNGEVYGLKTKRLPGRILNELKDACKQATLDCGF